MLRSLASTALLLSLSASAHATTWHYTCSPCTGNPNGGNLIQLDTSFDDVTNVFTFDATFDDSHGLPDGGWLVVSGGPNPKNHVSEYVILYLDGDLGRATSYVYDGVNSSNSWQDVGGFLFTHDGAVQMTEHGNGDRTISLTLDATAINAFFPGNPDWVGVAFGAALGYWYHPTQGSDFCYEQDGTLCGYGRSASGWYDKKDLETVPEPSLAALGLFGLAGLVLAGRRR